MWGLTSGFMWQGDPYYQVEKGGHFAAWEQPQLLSEEILAAFRSLR